MTTRRTRQLVLGAFLLAVLVPLAAARLRAGERVSVVAVFPVENLSGGGVPADEISQFLVQKLETAGVSVVDSEVLDTFMRRHRVRYAAGVDAVTAQRLKEETSAEAVLIASVELSNDAVPPKVSMTARLVSLEATPAVVWADDVSLSGDDAPGLLDLGLVNDFPRLFSRALGSLGDSLVNYLGTGTHRTDFRRASKFRPRVTYRGLNLEPGRVYSVAVLPFFNVSDRRNAGEILAMLFKRHLSALGGFRVVDTGEVRQQLLQARVIMAGGVSISDAEVVATILDADFVLAGRVLYYEDYEGPEGRTRVDFSTVLIERSSRRVVWSSHSYNDGDDGVRFFGRGRSRTAHAMATQMVRLASEQIAGDRK